MSYADDVAAFNQKFGLPVAGEQPRGLLDDDRFTFRVRFLEEELAELRDAQATGDLAGFIDALVDLVYVAIGTAHYAGLDFDAHWAEVQRANMQKERPTGPDDPRLKPRTAGLDLGTVHDIVKPADWRGPDHEAILALPS